MDLIKKLASRKLGAAIGGGVAGAVQQHDTLAVEQIVGHALHVPNAGADFISVYLQVE